MAETHFLKTWPQFYRAVARGDKRFEVRKDDRAYQAGDVLVLQEYDPERREFNGPSVRVRVTFVLRGGEFGIEPGFVVMSLGEPTEDDMGPMGLSAATFGRRGST